MTEKEQAEQLRRALADYRLTMGELLCRWEKGEDISLCGASAALSVSEGLRLAEPLRTVERVAAGIGYRLAHSMPHARQFETRLRGLLRRLLEATHRVLLIEDWTTREADPHYAAEMAEPLWQCLNEVRDFESELADVAVDVLPSEAAPAAAGAGGNTGPRKPGKRMAWQEAKKKGERYCRKHSFPGVRKLADEVGCSPSTMSRAIDCSDKLRAMLVKQEASRGKSGGKSAAACALNKSVLDATAQTREPTPLDAAIANEDASTDDIFNRIMQQAAPAERERLNAMTRDDKRMWAATLRESSDS